MTKDAEEDVSSSPGAQAALPARLQAKRKQTKTIALKYLNIKWVFNAFALLQAGSLRSRLDAFHPFDATF